MKTIKIVTELGIHETKPKKVFDCKGQDFAIVDFPYKYMNSTEISYTRKIVHFNTGISVPVYAQHKQTLKDFIRVGIDSINGIFERIGEENFNLEISKHNPINC